MTEEEKQALLKSASDAAAAAAAEVLKKAGLQPDEIVTMQVPTSAEQDEAAKNAAIIAALKKAGVKLPEVQPAPHVQTKEEADAAAAAARAKALADAEAAKSEKFSAGVAQFLKDEKEKKYGGREI